MLCILSGRLATSRIRLRVVQIARPWLDTAAYARADRKSPRITCNYPGSRPGVLTLRPSVPDPTNWWSIRFPLNTQSLCEHQRFSAIR